jgi:hypothetical protein
MEPHFETLSPGGKTVNVEALGAEHWYFRTLAAR